MGHNGIVSPVVPTEMESQPSGQRVSAAGSGEGEHALDLEMFKNAKRVLVFTDMSTECDDECALLWLLSALNKRKLLTIVELVMVDSHARYQWMQHLFRDKLLAGGGATPRGSSWQVKSGGSCLQVGIVLVKMYLVHSPGREAMVIKDIQQKAPHVKLSIEEVQEGEKTAKRAIRDKEDILGGNDYDLIPAGEVDRIVVAGPIPDLPPSFFDRFTGVKAIYVVGTPGGVNCPMPSWTSLLRAMHKCAPILYLTPQFTRGVRFPRGFVVDNKEWNEEIKRTIFDGALMNMARRPEIPAAFGNWGLLLRLNAANATFCRDWFPEVSGLKLEETQRPEMLNAMVQAYVDRGSGEDRKVGAVVNELRLMGVDVSKETRGDAWGEPHLDASGQPTTPEAKEAVRELYRQVLFEEVMTCVLTTETLIFRNRQNFQATKGAEGFEQLQPKCGYKNPLKSLAELFGNDEAIEIVRGLPVKKLTPAYDVVAMICMVAGLEGLELEDLPIQLSPADATMNLLSAEEMKESDHPILMAPEQKDEAIENQVRKLEDS